MNQIFDIKATAQDKDGKFCPRCEITKSRNDFYRNRTRKDGLQTWCKSCVSKNGKDPATQERNRSYYHKNKIKRLEYAKAYYEANRDRLIEKHRERRRADGGRIRARARELYKERGKLDIQRSYRDRNKERVREVRRAYWEKNKDRIKILQINWAKKNHARVIELKKKARENLADHYVVNQITRSSKTLTPQDIPKEMVEVKRLGLQIKRELRSKT